MMFRIILAMALAVAPVCAQQIWVNEFHYDNAGGDSGEFFEIVAPSSFTDLASVTLSLYNGGNQEKYAAHRLDTFSLESTLGDFSFYSKDIAGIQNGAPDGFSLDLSGSVIQFLSYEGSFAASNGPASGLSSTDIGLSESGSTELGGSLGLAGEGLQYSDFSWTFFASASSGSVNAGQSFSAMPEPHETALVSALALLVFVLFRRLRGEPAKPA
jgi:uncharacterized protein